MLTLQQGDRLEINVTNELTISKGMDVVTTVVSISASASVCPLAHLILLKHWHGIDQLHSNWADGVDSVTQCPIIPGAYQLQLAPVILSFADIYRRQLFCLQLHHPRSSVRSPVPLPAACCLTSNITFSGTL